MAKYGKLLTNSSVLASQWQGLSLWSLHVLLVFMWVSFRYCLLPRQLSNQGKLKRNHYFECNDRRNWRSKKHTQMYHSPLVLGFTWFWFSMGLYSERKGNEKWKSWFWFGLDYNKTSRIQGNMVLTCFRAYFWRGLKIVWFKRQSAETPSQHLPSLQPQQLNTDLSPRIYFLHVSHNSIVVFVRA